MPLHTHLFSFTHNAVASNWFVTLYYKLLPAVRSSSKYGCRQSSLLYSISICLTGGGGGGNVAYVQQMKFIEGNRCWYKLQLSALHMHLLEQIQSYIEWTSLGWGKFGVTFQVQGHCQDHPMSHQGHSQGHIILEVIHGHFKVKLKNC